MNVEEAQSRLGACKRWQVTMYLMICTATMVVASWHMLAIVYIEFSKIQAYEQNKSKIQKMDIGDALDKISLMKIWPLYLYVYLCVMTTFSPAWHMFAIVFIGYRPEHYCSVADNSSLPPDHKGRAGLFDRCKVYVDIKSGSNETRDCTEGWVYMDTDGDQVVPYQGSTIVTQWDLVCDKHHRKDFAQSILVIGVMIGAMGFSALSDYIGRKPVYLFSQWAMIIVGVVNAYVTNYYAFLFLRFCVGALQQGIILTGFVLACELFAAKYRTFAGIIIEDFWGLASCILPLFAYLITDWKHFQVFISLFGLVSIPMFWLMPESVIWLTANDRNDEAERILQNAAKINKMEMPDRILERSEKDDGTTGIVRTLRTLDPRRRRQAAEGGQVGGTKVYTLLDVLRNKKLLLYTLIMACLWMVISLVYYGLSLSTATLAGNRYMNAFLIALIEIPAYTSSFFVLQKWGRRYPLIGYHCLAGVALILTQVIPEKTSGGTSLVWMIMMFNLLGKFGITGAFGIVFLYAPEIFPTTLRNQAMGISSLLGRLGNVVATYTPYATEQVPWLPGPLFGGLSIFAGLLVILLPETHNRPLPQTIEDIENWSKPQGPKGAGQQELRSIDNDVKGKQNSSA